MTAILPSIAASELVGIVEARPASLRRLSREMCLAWNPRLLRIRTALEPARKLFGAVFRIGD